MIQACFNGQWRTDVYVSAALVCVSGCMLPIVLMPIVWGIGHSVFVEELAKAMIIVAWIAPLTRRLHMVALGMMLGALFGVSESVFYLPQLLQHGEAAHFFYRTLRTVPMHVITTLIMVMFCWTGRYWFFLGLPCAILLHSIFNLIAW
jgi:hypothetical protein